jgi:hypothetical protein
MKTLWGPKYSLFSLSEISKVNTNIAITQLKMILPLCVDECYSWSWPWRSNGPTGSSNPSQLHRDSRSTGAHIWISGPTSGVNLSATGLHLLCGQNLYFYIPVHWQGYCTFVYVLPNLVMLNKTSFPYAGEIPNLRSFLEHSLTPWNKARRATGQAGPPPQNPGLWHFEYLP